jgi:hypothetical protein
VNPSTVAAIVLAVVASVGALATILRWFYQRGRGEEKLMLSMDRLTETGNRQAVAVDNLAGQVSGLRTSLEKHSERLTEHHWRLAALEQQAPVRIAAETDAKGN